MFGICRFCDKDDETVTDDVDDYVDQIQTLTQLEITVDGDTPTKVCTECIADLQQALAFRERCRVAEERIERQRRNILKARRRVNRSLSPESRLLIGLAGTVEISDLQPPPLKQRKVVKHVMKHEILEQEEEELVEETEVFEVVESYVPLQPKIEKIETYDEMEVFHDGDDDDDNEEFINYEALDEADSMNEKCPPQPKEGPWVCLPCGVSYTNRRSFSTHWHFKHRHANRRYECPTCGKVYKKSDQYKGHLNTHLEVLPFACDLCPARFARKGAVVKHMMVHTGQKSLKCQYCEKKFGFTIDLKRHLTIHTGIYIYNCMYCNRGFNRKKPCQEHEQSHLAVHTAMTQK